MLAALSMDWPRDKLNVYILDDGSRPEFRHIRRGMRLRLHRSARTTSGAKAGNINHALRHTKGELIAIFDCDHAPTRAFLQLPSAGCCGTRIAMVQTPHYFYSPDPFERNLAPKRRVPNEGLLFYGAIQPGNDLWNAAFFCGSCAVIRRTALEEVGGVPHITVTEDCHCSLLMQKRGWHTAYIRLPLAAGLATERLSLHIGQRLRWARGMMQIMRLEKTDAGRGLGLAAAVLLHGRLRLPVRGAAAGLPDLAAGLPVLRRKRHRRQPARHHRLCRRAYVPCGRDHRRG